MQSRKVPTPGATVALPREGAAPQGGLAAVLKGLLITARPKQWTKNFVIFLALIFSINLYWTALDFGNLVRLLTDTVLAFVVFCVLSSGVYFINDLVDIEKDRQHPRKRQRPLASGALSPAYAAIAAVALPLVSIPVAFWLNWGFGLIAAAYFVLMLAYSFVLKHLVIIDVFSLAGGFVLRAVAGAIVIGVPISPWLYICTVLGALFLGFNKRRHELVLLENGATNHRKTLEEYTPQLLDEMISVITPSTVIAYSLYTFSAENLPKNHSMMLTIPFVLYGVFRYLYLVHTKNQGGSPEEVLIRDIPIILDILLWLGSALAILLIFRGQ